MQVQEKKIKGFTILELMVVVTIIAIISAAAFPNFSSWSKERKTKQAATKIKNLISGINAQVQRGAYEFVQVRITENGSVRVITSGMGAATLATKKKEKLGPWNVDPNSRCPIGSDYWDDEGSIKKDEEGNVIHSTPGGASEYTNEDIAVNFSDDDFAVCFSKDGSYYSGNISSPLNVCFRTDLVPKCAIKDDGDPETSVDADKYLYRINWSRFGSVTLDKWNIRNEEWIQQD